MGKVLFIGIGFYDYDLMIQKELEQMYGQVDYYCETPNSLIYRFWRFNKNELKQQQIIQKQGFLFAKAVAEDYDHVFIIKCEYLSIKALEVIKQKNPNALWTLYLWDSVKRINLNGKTQFFDRVITFDHHDAEKYKFDFQPLFYRNEFDFKNLEIEPKDGPILFLGWYHSDRLDFLMKLIDQCQQYDISHRFILFTGRFKYFHELAMGSGKKVDKSMFAFKSISVPAYAEMMKQARAVIDIHHPGQSGLTMRTIELVGANKKMITTNQDISDYDFYHASNMSVIDRDNPVLDVEFLKTPFKPIKPKIREKYKLSNWVKAILKE